MFQEHLLLVAAAALLTMSGYVPSFGVDLYGNGSHQQQHHQQSRQSMSQQNQKGPCFEGYDPSAAPPSHNNQMSYAFNPTAVNAPAAFMPPFIPAGMEHIHLKNHIVQHHSAGMPQMSPPEKSISVMPMANSSAAPMMTFSTLFDDNLDSVGSIATQADPAKPASDDSWLDTIEVEVTGVALEPLSGTDVLQRVRRQTDNVVTCYLPCVEFLVNCQQELRAGLANATQKKLIRHAYRDNMTPRQFYNRYLAPLVERFHRSNRHLMEEKVLTEATQDIAKLCDDAQKVQNQGCEAMKNAFLGGMKDGESWGLRKWLSKNGGALHICNDLECILHACQKLNRSKEETVKLSERLRPLAKQALGRLKSDVPASYQEVSTAHPYLPFFHRLESALKGMANFDPEDDDVICIDDDDEIEEVKTKAKMPRPEKRPSSVADDFIEPYAKRRRKDYDPVPYDFGRAGTPPIKNPFDSDADEDSVIEIIDVKPPPGSDNSSMANAAMNNNDNWRCSRCTMLNVTCSNRCCMCSKKRDEEETCSGLGADNEIFDPFDELAGLASFEEAAVSVAAKIFDLPDPSPHRARGHVNQASMVAAPSSPQNVAPPANIMTANQMIQHLERLAYLFDINKQDMIRPSTIERDGFWDSSGARYARILHLLVSLIRNRDSQPFLNPVDQLQLNASGQLYSDVIRHPLCFRDIVHSLVDMDQVGTKSDGSHQPCGSGILPCRGLARWNMWRGFDFLQAIDLVFLNALAFNGKEKTKERSRTNRMRKLLWDEIHNITGEHFGSYLEDEKRRVTPTRRGEKSGFVIRKMTLSNFI